MKTMDELRKVSTDIINLINRERLTVEEGIFVIENAKFFLTMSKIVLDFDRIKVSLEQIRRKKP